MSVRSRLIVDNGLSNIIRIKDNQPYVKQQTKEKLNTMLEQQAEYLLERKQKQLLRKRKLKELEDQYQRQRIIKLKKLEDKIIVSQKNKQKNIKTITEKFKRRQQHYQEIIKKISCDNQESIDKNMEKRKEFESVDIKNKNSGGFSRATKDANQSQILSRRNQSVDIDNQMKKIQDKITRAQTNHLLFQRNVSQRAHNQIKNLQNIKKKAKLNFSMLQHEILNNYYERAQFIESSLNKNKGSTQKHCQQRRKNLQQKIRKCQENVKHLQSQKFEKLDELLRQKLEKKYLPKTWKNQKNEVYMERFLENFQRIEKQKYERGQQILRKHLQITNRNKIFKQKKDKIHQAIKKI